MMQWMKLVGGMKFNFTLCVCHGLGEEMTPGCFMRRRWVDGGSVIFWVKSWCLFGCYRDTSYQPEHHCRLAYRLTHFHGGCVFLFFVVVFYVSLHCQQKLFRNHLRNLKKSWRCWLVHQILQIWVWLIICGMSWTKEGSTTDVLVVRCHACGLVESMPRWQNIFRVLLSWLINGQW